VTKENLRDATGPVSLNRYDRFELGTGVVGWIYEYFNNVPVTRQDAMATGLEIGVQLRGEWLHDGSRAGRGLFGPGTVHVISPAERYSLECRARGGESVQQVGFIAYPDEISGFCPEHAEVSFVRRPVLDRSLLDLCRALQSGAARGRPLPVEQARSEILRWARDNVELAKPDPLVRAKKRIDKSFVVPFYLEHLADEAGMDPIVFSRRFARRFGMPPIAYRLRLRLNEAARLTWARPDLEIRAIQAAVGFEDSAYFHRAFLKEFGTTPSAYGRRLGQGSARKVG
jgi:AraC-like DNA-binding protein